MSARRPRRLHGAARPGPQLSRAVAMIQIRRWGAAFTTGMLWGFLPQTVSQAQVLVLTAAADALPPVTTQTVGCEVFQGCGQRLLTPATPAQVGEGIAEEVLFIQLHNFRRHLSLLVDFNPADRCADHLHEVGVSVCVRSLNLSLPAV